MNIPLNVLLVTLTLGGALLAQQPTAQFDFHVPLHTAPDDPVAGPYGLWASGPNYKASFHDGLQFYPVRGPDNELVQLHWRTESIRIGSAELRSEAPATRTREWNHELDHGAVTEVYDVLREGVEQSFVIERPAGTGDVVVTGRILGGLTAPVTSAAQQALEFSDSERAVVRYGSAIAFDESGRRSTVTTSFDGERIRLELDGSFLEGAIYPVTIDPLISPVMINTSLSAPVNKTSVAVDNSSGGGMAWVTATRIFSAGDHDAYGYVCSKDFSTYQPVYSDINSIYSTSRAEVAHVDGANRWVIAQQRDYNAGNSQVRAYFHDQGNTTLNSGVYQFPTSPAGTRWFNPKIGGSQGTGTRALIIFEEDSIALPNSIYQDMRYFPTNALTRTLAAAQQLNPGLTWVWPVSGAIVPSTVGNNNWATMTLVEDLLYGTGFGLEISFINAAGNTLMSYGLGTLGPGSIGQVVIAGTSPHRVMLAWTRSHGGTSFVETRRIDNATSGTPILGPVRTVASSLVQGHGNLDLASDWETESHWALTYTSSSLLGAATATVVRLGHSGGVTESATLATSSTNPKGPSIAFAKPTGRQKFLTAVGITQIAARHVATHQFTYSSAGVTTPYGTVCHPSASLGSNRNPYAGDELFRLEASPVMVNELAIFVFGFSPTSIPLGQHGFPANCSLAVNSAFTLVALNTSFFANSVSVGLPLPDAPVFIGNLFVQAAVLPASAAPFVTQGLGVQVR